MALTEEQKSEVYTRLSNGERLVRIAIIMGIDRQEIRKLRREDGVAFERAINSKTARLSRLNFEKNQIVSKLNIINAKIAKIEAK